MVPPDKISIRFFGSPSARYCASCGGSRTQAEMASSLFRRMYQLFGENVTCQFYNVDSDDISAFPVIERLKAKGRLDLPIVMLEDEVQSSGHVYPNRLTHLIKQKLSLQ